MGYTTAASEGQIASWGSANFYSVLLSKIIVDSATLTVTSEDIDVTGLNATQAATLVGLGQWSISIKARAFTTPRLGNVGTVVFSAGAAGVLHVDAWDAMFESSAVHDITELAALPANGPIWRAFRPDYSRVRGSLAGHADSGTALSLPHILTPGQPTLPTLTLLYGDSSTDEQISGLATLRQLGVGMNRGGLNTAAYEFTGSGAWTPAGTNSPLGATALGVPLWSQGGSAAGAIRFDTLAGSRYLTGADSFWKSLQIRCPVGAPVEVNIEVQGSGVLSAT